MFPRSEDLLVNPDLIKIIPSPSVELCIAAADGHIQRCMSGYYPSELVVDVFMDVEITEELVLAVIQRDDCLVHFLPSTCWTHKLVGAAIAIDRAIVLDIPQTLLTPALCKQVLDLGVPRNLAGRIFEHIAPTTCSQDLLTFVQRMPAAMVHLPEAYHTNEMIEAAAKSNAAYIRYAKGCIYSTWLAAGCPQNNKGLPRFCGKIRRRTKPAPPSLITAATNGELEDPVTLEPIGTGVVCGFLRGKSAGTWHLAGTADSLVEMIARQVHDSSFARVLVPHHNKCIDIRTIRWFSL